MEKIAEEAFIDELEKIAKNPVQKYDKETLRMSDAFYLAQKKVNKENRSRGRKNSLIGLGGAGVIGGAGYGIIKKTKPGAMIKKKVYGMAEKAGREAGITAGKATNAAAASYSSTVKGGLANATGKLRGGDFIKKLLSKMIFKK